MRTPQLSVIKYGHGPGSREDTYYFHDSKLWVWGVIETLNNLSQCVKPFILSILHNKYLREIQFRWLYMVYYLSWYLILWFRFIWYIICRDTLYYDSALYGILFVVIPYIMIPLYMVYYLSWYLILWFRFIWYIICRDTLYYNSALYGILFVVIPYIMIVPDDLQHFSWKPSL